MNIAVFVSGRGSNLNAIINSQKEQQRFEVKTVVGDKLNCPAFEIAEKNLIPVYSVGSKEGFTSYTELAEIFDKEKIELIVLAGYLKLIPVDFVSKYSNRVINIHPALLPSFGGKGMFGINVHKAVYESSAKVSGATVHFVDFTYDTGRIIAQRCVDISGVKSPEEIADRVLNIEHEILPYVVNKFAENKIKIINNRVVVLD